MKNYRVNLSPQELGLILSRIWITSLDLEGENSRLDQERLDTLYEKLRQYLVRRKKKIQQLNNENPKEQKWEHCYGGKCYPSWCVCECGPCRRAE